MRTYAAELNEQDEVIRVIVGDADWANEHLGGRWVPSPKAGPGWRYVDGEIVPPAPDPLQELVTLSEELGLYDLPEGELLDDAGE